MRTPGTYISAIGHVGLIGWLLLGWGLSSDPLEFDTMTVTTISGEEFEALTNPASTPDPGTAEPTAPVQPVTDAAPAAPAEELPTEVAPLPDPVEPPETETTPPPPPEAPPVPDATDVAPAEPSPPAPAPAAPDLPPSDDPTPRQSDLITSTPNAPPPPDAVPDDIAREEVVQDPDATPEVVTEEQEPTAPPESAPEIVIADETPSGAVETSIRPTARPRRPPAPEPVEEPVEDTQVATQEEDTSVDDLLADIVEETDETPVAVAPAVAAGPPMTGSERDAFRVAVNRCWNVDPGSVAARVTVEIGFSLDRSGKVVGNQVNLLASDGDQSATNTAFEAARRAILRCQSNGYQLPADKFDQWKDVVITFDPSGMRLR
jgi:hypothetical protein